MVLEPGHSAGEDMFLAVVVAEACRLELCIGENEVVSMRNMNVRGICVIPGGAYIA